MDISVVNLINGSLRLIGQMGAPGRQAAQEQLTEVLQSLQMFMDARNVMRNSIFSMTDVVYPLSANQYIYTIGPGGDFNGPRPQAIKRANLIYQTSPQELRLPIEVIDVDQWAAIQVPNIPAAIPLKLYYDFGYSASAPTGLGTIYLWPGPQGTYSLELFQWSALNSALSYADTLYMPPGYAKAIMYGLALDIMPLYPKRLTAEKEERIQRIADETWKWIESFNSPTPITQIDPALISKRNNNFNWLVSVS